MSKLGLRVAARVGLSALAAAVIGLAVLAPVRRPVEYHPGYWGGNTDTGWGDCLLRIQQNGSWCVGGYDSEDYDLDWYTQCDEDGCRAEATCNDGTQISCEGEYRAQAGQGAVYCFDDGGQVPTDNDSCMD